MRMTISLSDQLASHFLTLALNQDRAVTIAWSNAGPPAHYSTYDGAGQTTAAIIDQLRTLVKYRVHSKIETVSPARIQAILTALAQILAMT